MINKKKPSGLKILLGVVISLFFVYFLLAYVFRLPQYQSSPEIGRNLPSNYEMANREFLDRAQQKFPTGTTVENIQQELSRQGFQVKQEKDGKRYAEFLRPGFPCQVSWIISWRNGADGIVEDLTAHYQTECL